MGFFSEFYCDCIIFHRFVYVSVYSVFSTNVKNIPLKAPFDSFFFMFIVVQSEHPIVNADNKWVNTTTKIQLAAIDEFSFVGENYEKKSLLRLFGGLLHTCVKLLHIIQLNIFFFATNTQQFNRIDNANFFMLYIWVHMLVF